MRSPSGHPSLQRATMGLALVPALALVLAGCSVANAGSGASSPTPAAISSPAVETMAPASAAAGVPGVIDPAPGREPAGGAAAGTGGSTGTASGSAVASLAYPYPGTSGVAADHTIVVVGTGSATAASEAGRAAAQHDALLAALADARSQADAIASATHVTIDGVLSVSASQSPYVVYPMGIEAPANGATTPGAPPTTTAPQGPTVVTASVTVAWSIH